MLTRDLTALFSADRGYDQAELKRWLWDAHRVRPLIDIRLLWREDWDALPRQPSEPMLRPMAFHGLDERHNALKHLCPAAAYGLQCEGRAQCCANAGADPNKLGPTRRVLLNQANRCIFLPTPHGTRAWKEGYAKRSA